MTKSIPAAVLMFLLVIMPSLWCQQPRQVVIKEGLAVQKHYDTPLINPSDYSAKHELKDAPSFAQASCTFPGFQCIKVNPKATWIKLFPQPNVRKFIMHLNRTNVALSYRSWILVPKSWRYFNDIEISPFPLSVAPTHHKQLIIDLRKFAFAAYDPEGHLVRWGPATGGRSWCPMLHRSCRSAAGYYRIYRKKGLDCFSNKYPIITKGGAPMPYCMFYYKGFAIHASTLSGFTNESRGCIRLFFDDAKWLNTEFASIGTRVHVIR